MKRTENAVRALAQLNDIMEREHCFLRDFSVYELSVINDKKQQLIAKFETSIAELAPSHRDILTKDVIHLRGLAVQNLERLKSMKAAVSEARARLIAALQSQSALGLYDVSGHLVEGPKPISLARSF